MAIFRTFLAFVAAGFGLLLVLPIILAGLPFWFVASLSRAIRALFERSSVPWKDVLEFEPTVGWKPKGNLNTCCSFLAGKFSVKTDSQGWRGHGNFDESKIVVFGDSYAFGYGVDDQKAFFSARNSKLPIKAIGAPGYNMAQEVILMRKLSPCLNGKLTVWFVYPGNDLDDNLRPFTAGYRAPFVKRSNGNWHIETSHVSSATWPFNSSGEFKIRCKWMGTFGSNLLSERIYSACEFLIKEGRDICEAAGSRLVVVIIPWIVQLNSNEWKRGLSRLGNPEGLEPRLPDLKIGEICAKLGVPLELGRDYLKVSDHIPGEGHWNEQGHARMSKALEEFYGKYGLACEPTLEATAEAPQSRQHADTAPVKIYSG